MLRIFISILESIYLFYMFRFFKTTIDFNMSRKSLTGWKIFKHLTTNEKGLRMCPFGRTAILFFCLFLLSRHIINIPYKMTKSVFIITAILTILNFNALVYLLPVFTIEFLLPISTDKP